MPFLLQSDYSTGVRMNLNLLLMSRLYFVLFYSIQTFIWASKIFEKEQVLSENNCTVKCFEIIALNCPVVVSVDLVVQLI